MRLKVSKAKGLRPLDPHWGLRPQTLNPVRDGGTGASGPGGVQRRSPPPYLLAALLTLLALASCAPPPPPVLTLYIVGSAGQNPGAGGQGNPVQVQIYQLVSTGKFMSTDYYSLTGSEAATLGQDEMGASQQYLLTPGQKLTETISIKPNVTSVGAAVLFQQINRSTWRVTAPVAASGPTVLTLRINGLTATIGQ